MPASVDDDDDDDDVMMVAARSIAAPGAGGRERRAETLEYPPRLRERSRGSLLLALPALNSAQQELCAGAFEGHRDPIVFDHGLLGGTVCPVDVTARAP